MGDQASGLLSPWLRSRRFRVARPWRRGRVLDVGCGTGELCSLVDPVRYLGVDRDPESLAIARSRHPRARFAAELPGEGPFDTIALLAVIEHVGSPVGLLRELRGLLGPGGHLILTTPHPRSDAVHRLGARLGIFASEAAAEHLELLGLPELREAGAAAGLRLVDFRSFLAGMNQCAVFRREDGVDVAG
jgi:SAM-dependent methyltransferase